QALAPPQRLADFRPGVFGRTDRARRLNREGAICPKLAMSASTSVKIFSSTRRNPYAHNGYLDSASARRPAPVAPHRLQILGVCTTAPLSTISPDGFALAACESVVTIAPSMISLADGIAITSAALSVAPRPMRAAFSGPRLPHSHQIVYALPPDTTGRPPISIAARRRPGLNAITPLGALARPIASSLI